MRLGSTRADTIHTLRYTESGESSRRFESAEETGVRRGGEGAAGGPVAEEGKLKESWVKYPLDDHI